MEGKLTRLYHVEIELIPLGQSCKLWPRKSGQRMEIQAIYGRSYHINCDAQTNNGVGKIPGAFEERRVEEHDLELLACDLYVNGIYSPNLRTSCYSSLH